MATAPVFRRSLGLNNVIEAHRLVYREDGACPFAEGVNIIIDDNGSFKRRFGIEKLHDGGAHSIWSKGDFCFFISDGNLYRLLLNDSVVLVTSGVGDIPMYFEMMHGKVYCSNGFARLILTDTTVSNWIANVPSQMKDDKRVLGMISSFTKIKAHGGRFFVQTPEGICQSEPGNPACFDIANCLLPFKEVHDFVSVGSGMYLSCEDGVVFLEGYSKENFQRKVVYSRKAIPGTMTTVDGSDVGDDVTPEFYGVTAVWVSDNGVCFGDARGFVENKTSRALVFDKVLSGAGVIIPGQYFFSLEVE